jgi:hypothetical protein
MSKLFQKWTEEYGKTYGFYQGHSPFIVTSDLDFVNEICIKQYNNFSAKKVFTTNNIIVAALGFLLKKNCFGF